MADEAANIEEPKKRGFWAFTWKWLIKPGMICGFVLFLALSLLLLYYAQDLPSTARLKEPAGSQGFEIYDSEGELIIHKGGKKSAFMEYDEFPEHVVQAVLAIEDRRFFNHVGFDPIGIVRALLRNASAGRTVQGASTLTQQLAKNVFLTPERSMKRKVQELMLSLWLETNFTKKEIVAIYLNRVYLGGGNYGFDAASNAYFGKGIKDSTIAEAAILAGLLKSPNRNPHSNFEAAKERGLLVLNAMAKEEYISSLDVVKYSEMMNEEGFVAEKTKGVYFADWVIDQVPTYIGAIEDDLIIKTTFESKQQQYAEESVKKTLDKDSEKKEAEQAALLALGKDGRILAMVGGKDYSESVFNRTTQAKRQPGSAFKFFVYLAALEAGWTPFEYLIDEPMKVDGWRPKNYHHKYLGYMSIKRAYAESINTIAVQLQEFAGRQAVVDLARRIGVTSTLRSNASMALGSNEITVLEMAQAYAHMPSGGKQVRAWGISEIHNKKGDLLYKRKENYEAPQIIGERHLGYMNFLGQSVISQGTATRAWYGREVAGKTGTSSDYRDAWFVGYSANVTTAVWVGNDDNSKMKNVTGGSMPLTIWRNYMRKATSNYRKASLPVDRTGDTGEEAMPWLDTDGQITETNDDMGWLRNNKISQKRQNKNNNRRRSFWDNFLGRDNSNNVTNENITIDNKGIIVLDPNDTIDILSADEKKDPNENSTDPFWDEFDDGSPEEPANGNAPNALPEDDFWDNI